MSRIINDDNPTNCFELEDPPILPETLTMSSVPQVQVTEPGLESLRASIASMSAERFRMPNSGNYCSNGYTLRLRIKGSVIKEREGGRLTSLTFDLIM